MMFRHEPYDSVKPFRLVPVATDNQCCGVSARHLDTNDVQHGRGTIPKPVDADQHQQHQCDLSHGLVHPLAGCLQFYAWSNMDTMGDDIYLAGTGESFNEYKQRSCFLPPKGSKRLFAGQCPVNLTNEQLGFVCYVCGGGCSAVEIQDFRPSARHILCDADPRQLFAMVDALDYRVIFDAHGFWYAANDAQVDVLVQYAAELAHRPGSAEAVELPDWLPSKPFVLEESDSGKVPGRKKRFHEFAGMYRAPGSMCTDAHAKYMCTFRQLHQQQQQQHQHEGAPCCPNNSHPLSTSAAMYKPAW